MIQAGLLVVLMHYPARYLQHRITGDSMAVSCHEGECYDSRCDRPKPHTWQKVDPTGFQVN